MRRYFILTTKKCRIYAAFGVSQTPNIKINTKGDVRMKAHEYWSVGALITMLGTFYSGYKGSKSSHKYFAASSLLCMIMAIYTGHKMISKNKKTKKEPISLGNEE